MNIAAKNKYKGKTLRHQECLYSHGHKKKFSLGLCACACVDVCICLSVCLPACLPACLSVAVITRGEVMRRTRNFDISFTRIVSSAVQDRGFIKIKLFMFRSALQHLPFPMTFIRLSLKNIS